MLLGVIVICVAVALIYFILKIRNPPEEQEYYLASDVYKRLLTNDTISNLMIDFTTPINTTGPPGDSGDVESYDLDVIRRLSP
jgi:heme/copper-type cytochrome/quinol oxidase subunit 2